MKFVNANNAVYTNRYQENLMRGLMYSTVIIFALVTTIIPLIYIHEFSAYFISLLFFLLVLDFSYFTFVVILNSFYKPFMIFKDGYHVSGFTFPGMARKGNVKIVEWKDIKQASISLRYIYYGGILWYFSIELRDGTVQRFSPGGDHPRFARHLRKKAPRKIDDTIKGFIKHYEGIDRITPFLHTGPPFK